MDLWPKDKVYSEVSSEDIMYVKGDSYSKLNTLIAIPTRGMIHYKVIISWKAMMMPTNSHIMNLYVEGMEVGEARNTCIGALLKTPNIDSIFFLDDDVIVPEDALILLHRALKQENYDIIGGLYHKKDAMRCPLAFTYDDKILTNISPEQSLSGKIIEVDAIGMGCTLIKKTAFDNLMTPYFKTVEEVDGLVIRNQTEDIYFCEKAKAVGLKIGIHTGVHCGHMDTKTGIIY